ncbi:hypothetical protein X971_0653 [Agrobacterium tumefaciens LBA4213 (Ach5)]|nr:hypothetical protein X971_0653 [Agrobacterium tumefaciens LBA4213 (Ach5)]
MGHDMLSGCEKRVCVTWQSRTPMARKKAAPGLPPDHRPPSEHKTPLRRKRRLPEKERFVLVRHSVEIFCHGTLVTIGREIFPAMRS